MCCGGANSNKMCRLTGWGNLPTKYEALTNGAESTSKQGLSLPILLPGQSCLIVDNVNIFLVKQILAVFLYDTFYFIPF